MTDEPERLWTDWFESYQGLAFDQALALARSEAGETRIIYHDSQAITADFVPGRLNIQLRQDGSAERLWPG